MLDILGQFSRFFGAGVVSAVGHYGLLILLVQAYGVDSVQASIAGSLLGAGINYLMNYHFTFQSSKRHRESLTKFAIVASISVVLNMILMWIAVDVAALHYLLAQVLTTVLLLFWSFAANRWWTFRTGSKRG